MRSLGWALIRGLRPASRGKFRHRGAQGVGCVNMRQRWTDASTSRRGTPDAQEAWPGVSGPQCGAGALRLGGTGTQGRPESDRGPVGTVNVPLFRACTQQQSFLGSLPRGLRNKDQRAPLLPCTTRQARYNTESCLWMSWVREPGRHHVLVHFPTSGFQPLGLGDINLLCSPPAPCPS